MRSKASFRGHPAHPALIPFPVAFLTGAALFDLAGVLLDRPALWTTGSHLAIAGVVTGLVAAVPGLIDFVYTVPPRSSAKRRARRHMISMFTAIAIFSLVWWLRGSADNRPDTVLVAVEAVGLVVLMGGASLGGTLVTRNMSSVDHRYARAGKWREISGTMSGDGRVVTVARQDDLELDQMRLVRAGAHRLVLARTQTGYAAFSDRCTHRGGSLAGGVMICGTVQCLWHGSQFDVNTGQPKAGPAKEPIAVYAVRDTGELLEISLGPAQAVSAG